MAATPVAHNSSPPETKPVGFGNVRFDAIAGFLVFLIAMPLCLAIARASGYPPIAGIWTAVVGGILTTFLSNAQLTIKGPAAGLIVIVYGAVTELGNEFGTEGMSETDRLFLGYKLSLGIGVVAGVVQILFGLLRAGRLADVFPLTPVHGMLASIGIIIIAKQAYEVIGVSPTKGAGPLELIAEFPGKLRSINPEIAIIGFVGLMILFGLPLIGKRIKWVKKVPSQLIVLMVAIGLGTLFQLDHKHTYLFPDSFFDSDHAAVYEVGPRFLVDMPNVLKDPSSAFAFPDFRGLATGTGLQYLLLFTLIGSLESLLSAKAIELLDPWKRKTNFDRDLLAVGFANAIASAIGGLPMISEIVRSKANIDNGARTKWANAWHGVFLLSFVLLFPDLIHQIPLAALGAMLVYTGFRLASPSEFVRTFKVGSEQFMVFIGTIIATLATDLLIGISVGIGMKILFHLWHGAPIRGMFTSDVSIVTNPDGVTVVVRKAAMFTNWLSLRESIIQASKGYTNVKVDFSQTRLVDHSVMEKLHELENEFATQRKHLYLIGLEHHVAMSSHPLAARKSSANNVIPREPVNTV